MKPLNFSPNHLYTECGCGAPPESYIPTMVENMKKDPELFARVMFLLHWKVYYLSLDCENLTHTIKNIQSGKGLPEDVRHVIDATKDSEEVLRLREFNKNEVMPRCEEFIKTNL